jgi:hypothetical protein
LFFLKIKEMVMISFIETVSKDVAYLFKGIQDSSSVDKDRVLPVAVRLISGAGMVVSALKAVAAIPLLASSAGVVAMATQVALFIIFHDIFKIASNHIWGLDNPGRHLGGAIIHGIGEVVRGEENINTYKLRGTILKPVWSLLTR